MKQIAFILLITANLFSTSTFTVDMDETSGTIELGTSYAFEGYIHNTSGAGIVVQVTRLTDELPEGWTSSICFATTCYPPHINQATEGVDVNDSTFFDITFTALTTPGTAHALVEFMDLVTGEKDSILFTITTETAPSFMVDMEATNGTIELGTSHAFEGYIHNISDAGIVVQVTRLTNELPEGWTSSLCFAETCYPPYVTQASEGVSVNDSTFFDITFTALTAPGTATALVEFMDLVTGDKDSILFTMMTKPASFEISVPDTVTEILAGQSHDFTGYVYNTGDKPATVFMVRQQNNLPEGWSSQLCFGSCPQPTVDSVNTLIMNGDSLEYKITFYTDETPAEGNALLAFFVADEQDTIKQAFALKTTATDIQGDQQNVSSTFKLLGNYPNPFNPQTVISYQLPAFSHVELNVYTIQGKKVKTLVNGWLSPGIHSVQLNAADLSSGTYLYQVKANGQIKTGKMLLIK